MRNTELPNRAALTPVYADSGRDDVFLYDVFTISDGEVLTLVFESTAPTGRHGVWLKSDNGLVINGQWCPSVSLWADTAPKEVQIECRTHNRCLHLYNIWDEGNGRESQLWTSGMLVEVLPHGRRYRCNGHGLDSPFDKLVFRIERMVR